MKRQNRQLVLRLALYIEVMGAVPTAYRGEPLSAYAAELEKQYQGLRHELGPDASAVARAAGRKLIRTRGFAQIQTRLETAGLLSLGNRKSVGGAHENASAVSQVVLSATGKELLRRKAAFNCHRKLRHVDFLSALLHARRLEDQHLNIYPCPICFGLHVGHPQDAAARRRRSILKELELLDGRVREIERDYEGLLDRRHKLAAELQTMDRSDSP
jgi:hypothetical protein